MYIKSRALYDYVSTVIVLMSMVRLLLLCLEASLPGSSSSSSSVDIVDIIRTGLRDLPDCIGIVVASPYLLVEANKAHKRSAIKHLDIITYSSLCS